MTMKIKHALVIFILGFLINLIGALFKIMHWPFANILLVVATFLEVAGGILFLVKILTHPKIKDFLNW